MRIYLASRYSRREELCGYRDQLAEVGHLVTSRWLNGGHQSREDSIEEDARRQKARWAQEDFDDLVNSDLCISFTEAPRAMTDSRGGRHVEHGIALARSLRVWIVGPRENVFHCLGIVRQFDTWEAALEVLSEGQGRTCS